MIHISEFFAINSKIFRYHYNYKIMVEVELVKQYENLKQY